MHLRNHYIKIFDHLIKYKSMIFLAGPRQSGKTTLAKLIAEKYSNSLYFNYDIVENKKKLIENPYFYESINRKDGTKPLIILDEIHKFHNWKNYLKGVYDRDASHFHFLVLGSGRLNIYQKGGDSLAGRYLLFHLWPITLSEYSEPQYELDAFLQNINASYQPNNKYQKIWENLFSLSGFPDPFFSKDKMYYRLWVKNYQNQLIREDIRDLSHIQKVDQMALLLSLLPTKIGSPISIDNIARDLSVSFESVKKWLELFDTFFLTFNITPWSKKISRAIISRKKIYLMDHAVIDSPGIQFENMVALELYKSINTWNDKGFGNFSLHYIRNKEKQEVDFLVADNNKPLFMVETKLTDDHPSKSIYVFQNKLKIAAIQVINKPGICKHFTNEKNKISVISASTWFSNLP